MVETIKKAVIPAAGLGTRFLPATKAMPKEMLPIVDKPAIQYVVEEAVASGIDEIYIITGRGKRAIEDHFDYSPELYETLEKRGKKTVIEQLEQLENLANICYIRQKKPLGLANAIFAAEKQIGDSVFGVLLGDDIIRSEVPGLKQLISAYAKKQGNILALERQTPDNLHKYGVVAVEDGASQPARIELIVEKPNLGQAPSDLAVIGRYVFLPSIFDAISKTVASQNGEFLIADAIRIEMEQKRVFGHILEGKRYDIGNKLSYMETIVDFALETPSLKDDFLKFLRTKA